MHEWIRMSYSFYSSLEIKNEDDLVDDREELLIQSDDVNETCLVQAENKS